MAADDLSLLFRLRADNAQAKGVFQDTAKDSQVLAQRLKQSLGPELAQTVSLSSKAFSEISDHLNLFVGERLPLVGGAFVRVTENLREFTKEGSKADTSAKTFSKTVDDLSKASGKSTTEIKTFLRDFVQLEGAAAKNEAAFKFFGGSIDLIGNKTAKFLPQLEQAGTELSALEAASTGASAAIGGMALPIGIAVLALAAEIAVVVELSKEIFELAKSTAEYEGKLFDLSQQTGVSVETLSAFEVVARTTGSSIDALSQSLGIFQKNLEDAAGDRGSKAAIAFHKLGVEATDTEAALRQTIAALAAMPEGAEQTALALEVFGRGGKAFLAIAKESKGDIDAITEKLKGLGLVSTEQAKLADEFNDQLVLLGIQLRGAGQEAIPILLDAVKDLSSTLKDNRDIFKALQFVIATTASTITVPMKAALAILREGFTLAKPILDSTARVLTAIKEAIEFISGHPLHLPGFPSTTEPSAAGEDAAAKAVAAVNAATRNNLITQIQNEIDARKQLQAVLLANIEQRKQEADDAIANAQREFAAGRLTREELAQATILANRKKTDAEIEGLEIERKIKLQEQALAKDDIQKRNQLSNAIIAIDAQIASKRSELARSAQDLTAKSQLEERRDLLAHEQAQLEIYNKLGELTIQSIEREINAGVTKRKEGLEQIEAIENAALVARGQVLKKELQLAGIGPERQAVLDKIAALEAERTELQRKQSERRVSITQEEVRQTTEAALAEAETLSRIAETTDAARIASLRAQAALRVRSEEDTEKAILQIRLAAIDRENELAQIRNTAAKALIAARLTALQEERRSLTEQLNAASEIEDPQKRVEEQIRLRSALQQNVDTEIAAQGEANKERDRLDKELNQQQRINNAERSAIQSQGERDVEAKRQEDLENDRRYTNELRQISQDIKEIELDKAREVIRILQAHFASRKTIIQKQRELDIAEEALRHQRALDSIQRQKEEVDQEIKVLQTHLDAIKIGTTEEIEQYERLINELNKLKAKRAELGAQQDAEDKLNVTRRQAINSEADNAEKNADPLGRLGLDTESLQEFASTVEDSIVPLGEILTNTFQQVSDAIGQTIENWVLLGETGPAVMRKILAQALASIAAEAAVNAIKELALGFATLFFNPAESTAHFTAAALWGSIAGVAAVAGRGIAGDLFKQKGAAGGSGGSSGSGASQQLNPITLNRNQPNPTRTIVLQIQSNDSHIVKVVGANMKQAGELRQIIIDDGAFA